MPNTKYEEFRSNYLALNQPPRLLYCGVLNHETHWKEKRHKHDNSCEIVLVASGSGHTRIGNDVYRFAPLDLILYNEGVVHAESLYSQEEPLRVYYVVLENVSLEDLPANHLIPNAVTPILAAGSGFADLLELFELVVSECGDQSAGYEVAVNGLVQALLIKVIRTVNYHYNLLRADHRQGLGSRIREYLDEHFHQPLTLKSIAEHFCVSHYYMEHVFKAHQGTSPINYLIGLRLRAARRLLETTDYPVKAVATMAGYESAAYFCVAFKKSLGLPATRYRADHRKRHPLPQGTAP